MPDILDYDELVDRYESDLLRVLRSHGAKAEYLEMWVPDEDPVLSILNMVEAAEAFGQSEIAIKVAAATLPSERLDELRGALEVLGSVSVAEESGSVLVSVTGIGV